MGWGASPKYSAPEILSHKDFTLSSDLWSLGIILYVLYFRKWPYDGNTSEEVLESIKSKGQNELNQLSDDPQFDNLIRRL
jgi:serine/threonine protein kinase